MKPQAKASRQKDTGARDGPCVVLENLLRIILPFSLPRCIATALANEIRLTFLQHTRLKSFAERIVDIPLPSTLFTRRIETFTSFRADPLPTD